MRKLLSILFLAVSSFFCAFTEAKAATYYVSTGGNDGNTGSSSSPWRTIQKAANTASAGDTVNVNAGTYSEKVTFNKSGSSGNLITFQANGSVTVNGPSSIGEWQGIFNVIGKSYIKIKGFKLQNSFFFGVYLQESNNISIENIYTYNTGASGICVYYGSTINILSNKVEKSCYHKPGATQSQTQEAISLAHVNGFNIGFNEVLESGALSSEESTGGEGIDAKNGSSNGNIYNNTVYDLVRLGIYVDAWDQTQTNIRVYNNRVHNCRQGIVLAAEAGGTLRGVSVYNNLTYDNQEDGILVADWFDNGLRDDISIVNNTSYANGTYGIRVPSAANTSNVRVRNNIAVSNTSQQISLKSGVMSSNNLTSGDPKFVNAGVRDFRLQSGSPAINAGTWTDAPSTDITGAARGGNAPDDGAYEYQSGGTPPPPTATNLLSNPGFEADGSVTQTPSSWQEYSTIGGVTSGKVEASGAGGAGASHGGRYHAAHYNNVAYNIYTFQQVTGLTNGLYTLRAWVKSTGGQTSKIMLVKNYGGSERNVSIPTSTSTWQQVSITDINVTNGQCEVGFWSDSPASKWMAFDDVSLVKQ